MRGAILKFGVFAVIGVLLTVIVYNTVARPLGGDSRTYQAAFTDASGLQGGDDVRIAGVRVGKVDAVTIDQDRAIVKFRVLRAHRVTTQTDLAVRYADLLGARYLELLDPGDGAPPQPTDRVIATSRTTPALDLTQLFNGFKPLFDALSPAEVNTFTQELVAVLQGEGGTVTSLLSHLADLTTNLADRDQVLDRVVVNLNDVVGTVATHNADLANTINRFRELAGALAHDRTQIGDALGGADALAASLSGLLEQAQPTLHHDLARLMQVTATLANNHDKLDTVVQRLPLVATAVMRSGDYGSWINVYVCNLSIDVPTTGVHIPLGLAGSGPHSEVCR